MISIKDRDATRKFITDNKIIIYKTLTQSRSNMRVVEIGVMSQAKVRGRGIRVSLKYLICTTNLFSEPRRQFFEEDLGSLTTLLQNHFGKRLNRLPMSLRRAAISSARVFLGSGNNGRPLYFRSRWSTMGL